MLSKAAELKRGNIAPVDVHIRTARLRWFGHVVKIPQERMPNYLSPWEGQKGQEVGLVKTGFLCSSLYASLKMLQPCLTKSSMKQYSTSLHSVLKCFASLIILRGLIYRPWELRLRTKSTFIFIANLLEISNGSNSTYLLILVILDAAAESSRIFLN